MFSLVLRLLRTSILVGIALGILCASSLPVHAGAVESDSLINFDLQIPIPGINLTKADFTSGEAIALYTRGIYTFVVGLATILAVMMLVWAGVMWLTAGGDKSRVGEAQKIVTNSLVGLVLALGSYSFLAMINPELVSLKRVTPRGLGPINLEVHQDGLCCYKDGLKTRSEPLLQATVNGAAPATIYKRAKLTTEIECQKLLDEKRAHYTLVENAPQFYCTPAQRIKTAITPLLCWQNNQTLDNTKSDLCKNTIKNLIPPINVHGPR